MGCSATEATGLGFVCFVVINPLVLSANRVDFGLVLFHKFSNLPPPPPVRTTSSSNRCGWRSCAACGKVFGESAKKSISLWLVGLPLGGGGRCNSTKMVLIVKRIRISLRFWNVIKAVLYTLSHLLGYSRRKAASCWPRWTTQTRCSSPRPSPHPPKRPPLHSNVHHPVPRYGLEFLDCVL